MLVPMLEKEFAEVGLTEEHKLWIFVYLLCTQSYLWVISFCQLFLLNHVCIRNLSLLYFKILFDRARRKRGCDSLGI
jgi:hypothetical protein